MPDSVVDTSLFSAASLSQTNGRILSEQQTNINQCDLIKRI